MNPKIVETVTRHVDELKALATAGAITDKEHDDVGHVMMAFGSELIGLSDKGWETFTRIINESRAVNKTLKTGA